MVAGWIVSEIFEAGGQVKKKRKKLTTTRTPPKDTMLFMASLGVIMTFSSC